MSRNTVLNSCVIGILASLFVLPASGMGFSTGNSKPRTPDTYTTGNRPWGNVGTVKPAPIYKPPQPVAMSYFPGASPNTGWYPASQARPKPAGKPTVEVSIEGTEFYEQQNVIYTVRVVSDGNLKSLKPELPQIEGAALELLDGPVATARTAGRSGERKIINTYRYKLMPLHAGEIVIPAIGFTGAHADDRPAQQSPGLPATSSAGTFRIDAGETLVLDVLPADPSVNPWLPLHHLQLHANLQQTGPARAGKPVTLVLEMKAKGALGSQLPSLAHKLESPYYRIYRDSTETRNGIAANGRQLQGSRTETYTVIPLQDGLIRLPEVTLPWWDVDTHSAMLAGMPLSRGNENPTTAGTQAHAAEDPMFSTYFWAPMFIIFSLIAGFWLGHWEKTRPLFQAFSRGLSATVALARQAARKTATLLWLPGHARRLRMAVALLMPRSVKVWMCTRCLQGENDPDAWCAEFRNRVCQHLGIASHSPLSHVTEKIIASNPQAGPERLRDLARSLEGAIYGNTHLDFSAWKQELLHELRPIPAWKSKKRVQRTRKTLPALNPCAA